MSRLGRKLLSQQLRAFSSTPDEIGVRAAGAQARGEKRCQRRERKPSTQLRRRSSMDGRHVTSPSYIPLFDPAADVPTLLPVIDSGTRQQEAVTLASQGVQIVCPRRAAVVPHTAQISGCFLWKTR